MKNSSAILRAQLDKLASTVGPLPQ